MTGGDTPPGANYPRAWWSPALGLLIHPEPVYGFTFWSDFTEEWSALAALPDDAVELRPADTDVARLRDTLVLIASDRCETYTSGRCSDPGSGRSRISSTGTADQWCDPCRARDALDAAPETSAPTADRLARALHDADCGCGTYDEVEDPRYITAARAALTDEPEADYCGECGHARERHSRDVPGCIECRCCRSFVGNHDAHEVVCPSCSATIRARMADTPAGHRPDRDDEVAAWIKRHRGKQVRDGRAWLALDDLLDDYRLHADTGTPLDQPAHENGEVGPDVG